MSAVFGIIGSILVGVGKSLLTEKFIKWALFRCAEMLVKKTTTVEDDAWLERIRKEVYGEQGE